MNRSREYARPAEKNARVRAEAVSRHRKLMRKRMEREGYGSTAPAGLPPRDSDAKPPPVGRLFACPDSAALRPPAGSRRALPWLAVRPRIGRPQADPRERAMAGQDHHHDHDHPDHDHRHNPHEHQRLDQLQLREKASESLTG